MSQPGFFKVGREGIEPLVATSLFCDIGVTNRREERDPDLRGMSHAAQKRQEVLRAGLEPALARF